MTKNWAIYSAASWLLISTQAGHSVYCLDDAGGTKGCALPVVHWRNCFYILH